VEEYISVDIAFTSPLDKESARDVLSPAVQVDFIECFGHLCSVRIPVSALTNRGSANSEGDFAMFADIARLKYSVNGSGILSGVLSDSFDCYDGATSDILSKDLLSRNNLPFLDDLNMNECLFYKAADEGRAMMQLIHDVAPGARLAFRTTERGETSFATGILLLAAAGCDVIVNEVIILNEPMFQDGIISLAVDTAVSKGVAYFSSAGNFGRWSWVARIFFVRRKLW
jgi:hypothetical protein